MYEEGRHFLPIEPFEEVESYLAREEQLTAFNFFKILVQLDSKISHLELQPYLHVWEEEKNGKKDSMREIADPIRLDRDTFKTFNFDELVHQVRIREENPHWNIAIRPKIGYSDEEGNIENRYFGFADMELLSSDAQNLELLLKNIHIIFGSQNEGGVIINSGNSYHYVSNRLFYSASELLEFYGASLRLTVPAPISPSGRPIQIADGRYIGSILTHWNSEDWESWGGIRLNSGSSQQSPTVVALVS